MKVAGIIAEFNPFHDGHKYITAYCKRALGADYVVVVMSGDFVQRGAPALISKFDRARMALECGADVVLELPVYYSLGSAEFFAEGAVSILDSLGVVTDLVFGSESDDIEKLSQIASILSEEPADYKTTLQAAMSEGMSFPAARTKALSAVLTATNVRSDTAQDTTSETPTAATSTSASDISCISDITSLPNSILGIEYIKALTRRGSAIVPHAIRRIGAGYADAAITSDNARLNIMPINQETSHQVEDVIFNDSEPNTSIPTASALGIRKLIMEAGTNESSFPANSPKSTLSSPEFVNTSDATTSAKLPGQALSSLSASMPKAALDILASYPGAFLDCDAFSEALRYKLTLEKPDGFTKYLDINEDLSNRIIASLPQYESFEQFCMILKTKNLTYTKISRCLMHILLNITEDNMNAYKADNFTAYGRILGMKKEASDLLSKIHKASAIPVPGKLKDFEKELSPLQLRLFNETLTASEIYNQTAKTGITSEYSLRPIVIS